MQKREKIAPSTVSTSTRPTSTSSARAAARTILRREFESVPRPSAPVAASSAARAASSARRCRSRVTTADPLPASATDACRQFRDQGPQSVRSTVDTAILSSGPAAKVSTARSILDRTTEDLVSGQTGSGFGWVVGRREPQHEVGVFGPLAGAAHADLLDGILASPAARPCRSARRGSPAGRGRLPARRVSSRGCR